MKKERKPYKLGVSEKAIIKALWPVFGIALEVFFLLVVLLPLAYSLGKMVVFWIGFGIVSVLIALFIVMGLVVLHRYGKASDLSLKEMENQLEDFSRGDVKLITNRHISPSLDKFQDDLNFTLSTYGSFHLAYEMKLSDVGTQKRIDYGEIFSLHDFEKILSQLIQRNTSFRSALLLFRSVAKNPSESHVMRALYDGIREAFPKNLIGIYDDSTYAVYLYSIDSFISLRLQAERFVSSYKFLNAASETDSSAIAYCKIGGVVYPYVSLSSLIKEAHNELEKSDGVSLRLEITDVHYPHVVLTESSKRIIYLSSVENFEVSFQKAKKFSEGLAIIKKFASWVASETGFESYGLLSYQKENGGYEVLFEDGKENYEASFSKLGNFIAERYIEPYFEVTEKELSFFCRDISELPSDLAASLLNLKVMSFFFYPISYEGEKRGFIYFTNPRSKGGLTMLEREGLERYSALTSSYLSSLQERLLSNAAYGLLEASNERSGKFIYTINRSTYRLSYLSENLRKAFPKAKLGDLCHVALRGSDEVCPHCPLFHGLEKTHIKEISEQECFLSLLPNHTSSKDKSSIIIEENRKENAIAESRFLDPVLLIKNKEAFALAFSRSLKGNENGYLLAVRLLDRDDLLKKAQGADINSIMSMLVKNIQDAGYGGLLYRYSDFELLFLLRGYPKKDINGFVEELSAVLEGPLEYQYVKLYPEYAFSAISYPGESTSVREAYSLIRGELDRSEKMGAGYLSAVSDNRMRKALRDEYVDDLLGKTLARDVMPIAIQPAVEPVTGKLLSCDILARLYGDEGDRIPTNELFSQAAKKGLMGKLDMGSLWSLGNLLEDYGEAYFSKSSLHYFSIFLSDASLKEEDFVHKVHDFYDKYHLSKGYIHFVVKNGSLKDNRPEIKKAMSDLKELGIVWESEGINPDNVSIEDLKDLGIAHLRTEKSLISRVVNNASEYSSFSRFVASALRDGFYITCTGIETKEEKEVAEHLMVSLLMGKYFYPPLDEKEFIQSIAYQK